MHITTSKIAGLGAILCQSLTKINSADSLLSTIWRLGVVKKSASRPLSILVQFDMENRFEPLFWQIAYRGFLLIP